MKSAALGFLLVFFAASAPLHARPARGEKPDKTWINAGGWCVIPLDAQRMPKSTASLAAAIDAAYRASIEFPADSPVAEAQGDMADRLESLRVNLSDAVLPPPAPRDKDKPAAKPPEDFLPAGRVKVKEFKLQGHRMTCGPATFNFDLSADDAQFDFAHDSLGAPLLIMTAARAGELSFEVSVEDLEALILASFKQEAGRFGLAVNGASLTMRTEVDENGGRTLRTKLHLRTAFAGVPAGLNFGARLDIDRALNGRLSRLSCNGDDILGPLISGLIQPALKKYDDKTRPLVRFPKDRIHLRDVKIEAGESLRFHITFGA